MDELNPTSPINQKLDYIIRTLDEQDRMITSLHKAMVIGRAIKAIYWLVVIGVTIGAFYFVQPIVDDFVSMYKDVNGNVDQLNSFLPR